ncbi:MAG TPA: Gfo/Idh/MocA family oxidoreductase [Candidatus Hydrogenedentes bacterium]|nr:Gfo/Idh/MocA family oxidoreductase [Candidatus Hydrogenedentota bacterium]
MKRIIQVGVGGMGREWTDVVAASSAWAGVAYVDTNEANLIAAAARHGMPRDRCFTDYREAIAVVEAEALLDVTPQRFRRQVCAEAFRRGLHVLCEKPLAPTVKDAKDLVARAKQAKRTLMVAQNYRYQPVTQTIKRFIEKGRLGDVGYVEIRFHKGPHFGGYREEMPYPLILDMSIHHVDMLRGVLGTDIASVQAASVGAPWSWYKGDATVMAQWRCENGATANYCASWVSGGWETTWNADWRFDGSKGALMLEGEQVFFSDKPGSRRAVPLVKFEPAHQAWLLEAFARALTANTEPETSGRDNLNSLAATHAMVRAAKERRWVTVRELLA